VGRGDASSGATGRVPLAGAYDHPGGKCGVVTISPIGDYSTPGRIPQTAKGLRRRSLILKVASKLFADRGFDKVSIQDIGKAAGVTGPAIYRYFPSKESLLVSAFDHLYQRASEGFGAILAESVDEREALEKLIDFEIQLVNEEPEKIRIADSEVRHLPESRAADLRAQNLRHLKVWSDVLRKVRPDLGREEVDGTVHALLAMLNSASRRRGGEPLSPGMRNHLRDMAHRMVLDQA